MKTITVIPVLVMISTCAVLGDAATLWRVQSETNTVITSIDVSGTLEWTNSSPGYNDLLQQASSLYPPNWKDVVRLQTTGMVTTAHVFDLNPPAGAVLIPEGNFIMGNATNVFEAIEGSTDELPQHQVHISGFYMERHEVTKALWDDVKAWAETQGYEFENDGQGKAPDHPVYFVNWRDCVKWCNARSERAGLTPCYSQATGGVYRTGISDPTFNTTANGYRLPTEAEWEKAARGGAQDLRFPWEDSTNLISHANANYQGRSDYYDYDISLGYHPTYTASNFPYTSPVGSFEPNNYGLYDMAGNVREWCWDKYHGGYYAVSPATNPLGAATSGFRVLRDGGWSGDAEHARVTYRTMANPETTHNAYGFRCARGL